MTDITLFGAAGRMGSIIIDLLSKTDDINILHAVDHPSVGKKSVDGVMLDADTPSADFKSDVWVDVSLAEPAVEHALAAERAGIPMLIAATGFTPQQQKKLESLTVANIIAPNMSPGINLLSALLPDISGTLGTGYDVAISETHHIHKLDRPSGTARLLEERLGKREKPVDTSSYRLGEIVGEHTVRFVSEGEEFTLSHRAFSRKAFASGVAPAVRFLHGKTHGSYTMMDVFGLRWLES